MKRSEMSNIQQSYFPYEDLGLEFEETIENEAFSSLFLKKVDAFASSNKRIFAICLSGFSGVGKSTISQTIMERLGDAALSTTIVPNNLYLATEAQTKERTETMGSSWSNFQKRFYDFGKLTELATNICESPEGETVVGINTYRRFKDKKPYGKLDGTFSLQIPKDKFAVIFDGINSIEYAKSLEGFDDVELLNVFVSDDPAKSFLRALFRNCIKKNLNIEDIIERKLKEYFYMKIWMAQNVKDSDIMVNNSPKNVIQEQIVAFQDMSGKRKADITVAIQLATTTFQDKISRYPDKFNCFSLVLCKRINDIITSI